MWPFLLHYQKKDNMKSLMRPRMICELSSNSWRAFAPASSETIATLLPMAITIAMRNDAISLVRMVMEPPEKKCAQ